MWIQSLGQEDPLEEEMATHSSIVFFFFFYHSSILAWKIPWTEEPGGLQKSGMTEHTHACIGHTHAQDMHTFLGITVWVQTGF